MKFWKFNFSDNGFTLLTPLFLLIYSFGDIRITKHCAWWGFIFYWKRNPSLKEWEELFLKKYEICFREYPYHKFVESGRVLPI